MRERNAFYNTLLDKVKQDTFKDLFVDKKKKVSSFNFAKRDSKEPFSLTKSTMSTDNLDIELDFSKKMDLFEKLKIYF